VTVLLDELTAKAPKPDEISGVFPVDKDGKIIGDHLHDFNLPLASKSADLEEDNKDQPQLQIRAKFTPYSALRQRFWRT
jgi:phosphatidylserine decarboxylase